MATLCSMTYVRLGEFSTMCPAMCGGIGGRCEYERFFIAARFGESRKVFPSPGCTLISVTTVRVGDLILWSVTVNYYL